MEMQAVDEAVRIDYEFANIVNGEQDRYGKRTYSLQDSIFKYSTNKSVGFILRNKK
jgi:hypothetical protein